MRVAIVNSETFARLLEAADFWADYLDGNDREEELEELEAAIRDSRSETTYVNNYEPNQ